MVKIVGKQSKALRSIALEAYLLGEKYKNKVVLIAKDLPSPLERRDKEVIDFLRSEGGEASLGDLVFTHSFPYISLQRLLNLGLIEIEES